MLEADVKAWAAEVPYYRKHGPATFAQDLMGATPTQQQWDASDEFVKTRRLSIRSGHGTGKTAFMAWCVLWYLSCYFPCKVPCTAPTSHQLSDILWAEISLWLRKLDETVPQLAAEIEWTGEKIFHKAARQEAFAVARTSRPENPEALQGFHSENILFLIDEASGVADKVFEVAEGALSSEGAWVLMAANPTRQDGYFFDSHHKSRAQWSAMHWDGEASPRVSRQYIENMRKKYGVDSPIYQVRVKGNFCSAPDGVIPLALCESAQVRDVMPIGGDEIWGVDVARFGDDSSALAKRRVNTQIGKVREWYGKDTMQTAGIIVREYNEATVKPVAINIDVIGIGAGVVDRLKEIAGIGDVVNAINVAESPSADDQYERLRDELWFAGKAWLEARDCKLDPEDDALVGELTTPKYKILSSGKLKVESKAEMRARGVKSPNLADAFLNTFARCDQIRRRKAPDVVVAAYQPLDPVMGY